MESTGPSWTPPGPSWLFCPADRPERYAKAAAAADVVILDLEDGVAPADRAAARQALLDTPLDPEHTVVRINAHGSEDQRLDLEALRKTRYSRVMLPKCESPEQVRLLMPYGVIALIESPLGVLTVTESVQEVNAVAVMWGAEDLIAGLGGTASRRADGSYREVACHLRSTCLLAAKAYGRLAIDGVFLDIANLEGLRAECDDAVAVGFDVKVAIHPSQVLVIGEAFAPSEAEVDWARRVLAAAEKERGVFSFEGKMVDAPVFRHAEQIIRRAGIQQRA
ncbi:HpcH/HpaI aldolase/citrate lyase family protein [Nocardia aobensis]|uniref:HpcH/HpaI aldolase/citrate lyase family protein n=1 Tax=Nocardia aobensis TaxID=257277 RepID=A0ABW6PFC3_9NOCA